MLIPNVHSFLLIRRGNIKSDFSDKEKEVVVDFSRQNTNQNSSEINDEDKRIFIKALGVAGIGVAAATLLPKKAHALIMGSSPTTGVVGVKDSTNTRVNPAREETVASLLKASDLTFDTGSLQVKVTSLPSAGSSSFSDSGDVSKLALVDDDRNVQVDIVDSSELQKINFGGVKFALRMETDGVYDYIGEAAVGTLDTADDWRIKRIENTASGLIVTWAGGTSGFDHIWDNGAGTDYSDLIYS